MFEKHINLLHYSDLTITREIKDAVKEITK